MKDWQELIDKYPELFYILGEKGERLQLLVYTMECGFGWYDLIETVCSRLWSEVGEKDPEFKIDQIKEKFGGLRIYTTKDTVVSEAIISFAEAHSFKVCESCGAPGGVKDKKAYWIKVRCPECT